jgi:intraflagellar transport protein 57
MASKEIGSTESLTRQTSRTSLLSPSVDDTLDKLKYLNYTQTFCQPNHIQPLTRYSLLVPSSNPNEQYYTYVLLLTHLLNSLLPTPTPVPAQFDDPNATCGNLIATLKSIGITDISPSRLKQGWGDCCTTVLSSVVDLVIAKSPAFQQPIHKMDEYAEEAFVDVDAEVTTDTIVDNIHASVDDDDDELVLISNQKANLPVKEEPLADPTEWRLEVERVTPLLKVVLPNDKQWRTHVALITTHLSKIEATTRVTNPRLVAVSGEVEEGLEKIKSREKYIQGQFGEEIEVYKRVVGELALLKQKVSGSSASVNQLSTELASISEELESVKSRIDELGSGMTDSKPLMAIKHGSSKIKVVHFHVDGIEANGFKNWSD